MTHQKKNSISKSELSPDSNVLKSEGPFIKDPDNQYLLKVRHGDQRAFKWLFDKYKGRVVSFLYHLTRDKIAAEDIAQDVFLKVFRFQESFDEHSKFSAWLWAIARNTGLDYLRKKKDLLLDDNLTDDQGPSLVESVEDVADTAEIQLINESEQRRIMACIDQLPINQKEALLLRTFSELSYDEIAKNLKLSLASIKSLINRAKTSLTKCIEKGAQK